MNWVVEDLWCYLATDTVQHWLWAMAASGPLSEWEMSFLDGIKEAADRAGPRLRISFRQWRSLVQIAHNAGYSEPIVCMMMYP